MGYVMGLGLCPYNTIEKVGNYGTLIGERAKRARHSQVCSIENHDICLYYSMYVTFAL